MEVNPHAAKTTQRSILLKVYTDLFYHAIGVLAFGIVVYAASGSLRYLFLVFLGGILIDLDHFIDYFLFFKQRFRVKALFMSSYLRSGRIYLVLHSWELVLLLVIFGELTGSYGLFICSLSMAMHLGIDTVQRQNHFMYFFLYRFFKKFEVRTILPEFEHYPSE